MKKDQLSFIIDILDCTEAILAYTKGLSKRDFMISDDYIRVIKTQDAIIRRIEIIGEAVKNLHKSVKEKNPEVDWKGMAGMRDRLIHKYYEIDLDMAWEVATRDIKVLKKQMLKIKSDLEKK